jgi:hypothetical protein
VQSDDRVGNVVARWALSESGCGLLALGNPTSCGAFRHAPRFCRCSHGSTWNLHLGRMQPWSPEPFPLRPGTLQACHHAFPDAFPFELRQGSQDVKLKLACRCRAIDALTETDERHSEVIQVFKRRCATAYSARSSADGVGSV